MKGDWTVKNIGIVLIILIVAGAGYFYWQQKTNGVPDGFLLAGGRIEGREVIVSSRVPGRIAALPAEEGSVVEKGDVLAVLESEQLQAQVRAGVENVRFAQRQFEEAAYEVEYTKQNADSTIWAAQAALDHAKAELVKARAIAETAQRNYLRYAQLYENGAIPAVAYDTKRLEYDMSYAEVAAVGQMYESARANLAAALTADLSLEMKQKQLAASRANCDLQQAKLEELQANLQELQVRAPLDGTIITRPVETGQVVNAVFPLFVLVDLKNIYMKIYIPEVQVGKMHLGNEARIYVDAYPGRYFNGKVTKISDKAEFTPKNVETKEERVKLVFAVEVAVENPEGLLKPGMPGDVLLRWREELPWINLK